MTLVQLKYIVREWCTYLKLRTTCFSRGYLYTILLWNCDTFAGHHEVLVIPAISERVGDFWHVAKVAKAIGLPRKKKRFTGTWSTRGFEGTIFDYQASVFFGNDLGLSEGSTVHWLIIDIPNFSRPIFGWGHSYIEYQPKLEPHVCCLYRITTVRYPLSIW